MNALRVIKQKTYMTEHNPNCASPFLVRLVAPGEGRLDKLNQGVSKDIIGYGQSFREAAEDALQKENSARAEFVSAIQNRIQKRQALRC